MDKAMNKLQDVLSPIAFKLDQNRYLTAIKSGFFGAMSLLILGSVFLLIANLPITGYPEMMAGLLGENWQNYFMVPYDMTMEIITPFVIVGIAKSLSNYYKVDDIGGILLSLASFLILTPTLADGEGLRGIPMTNLSASGLFVGMIGAICTVEIYRYVVQKGWIIKLPDSVPENVSRSFSALIPGFFVIVIFNLIRIGFGMTGYETAHNFIFEILQAPLLALGRTLPAYLIAQFFTMLLWFFGIHGANVVGAVMSPIWLSLTVENASAYASGEALPNIITSQFGANFVTLGGSGATIGLALVTAFFAKSKQYKTLGRLSLGPGLFNINEPLFFGIPLVLNPIMMIPLFLAPLTMAISTYFVMSIGLVPFTNGANIPWTTPPIISGFLVSGWQGAVWQTIQIVMSAAIYYPFFKIVDQKAYLTQTEGEEAVEEIVEGSVEATQPTES
jgi:PTS system cellobiose-specific IIC component